VPLDISDYFGVHSNIALPTGTQMLRCVCHASAHTPLYHAPVPTGRLTTVSQAYCHKQPLMEKIIQELNLTVVQKCDHQFEKDNMPYGCTIMYLLS
jgi:hypothetical protein